MTWSSDKNSHRFKRKMANDLERELPLKVLLSSQKWLGRKITTLVCVTPGMIRAYLIFKHRAGRDDVTTGKLFPSRGECLGLYRCVLIIFKRK